MKKKFKKVFSNPTLVNGEEEGGIENKEGEDLKLLKDPQIYVCFCLLKIY
jgi:hypothetical protein